MIILNLCERIVLFVPATELSLKISKMVSLNFLQIGTDQKTAFYTSIRIYDFLPHLIAH